jgi:hypothetical protein
VNPAFKRAPPAFHKSRLAEHLHFTEVLPRAARHVDLQALFVRRDETDSGPEVPGRCSVVLS